MERVTRIKGLSDRRRMPRLGIIRLGLKMKNAKGVEYPTETDYFVVPNEVAEIFGKEPKELPVMFPTNSIDDVFPQAYKHYGSSKGLICEGDGEKAQWFNPDTKEREEKKCPCELLEQGKCKATGTLQVMIPKVSVGGVYQIRTGSFNSIVDINSGLDYVHDLLGHFALVPLMLRRVKTETHHDEKKQNHYTLQIIFDENIDTINQLRADTARVIEHSRYTALPAPIDTAPEDDAVDITELNDEEKEEKPKKKEGNGKPISSAQVIAFKNNLKSAKITEEEFCHKHDINNLEELPLAKQMEAIQWIFAEEKNRA